MFLVLLDELILHREAFGRIDCAFFRNEVANMSVRSKDVKVLTEVLFYCSRLGGRFNYDKVLTHSAAWIGDDRLSMAARSVAVSGASQDRRRKRDPPCAHTLAPVQAD